MTQPAQLGPVEQEEVLQRITNIVLASPPPGWQRIIIEYMGLGNHVEGGGAAVLQDGSHQQWEVPPEVWQLFIELRAGMHQENYGTWLSCRFQLTQPNTYTINFNREQEPAWLEPRTASDYEDEYRFFPRSEEHMPTWFREKLDSARNES